MTVTHSRYKFVPVSIMKQLCNGRFASENRRLKPKVVKSPKKL
jgi:hypothetical protein